MPEKESNGCFHKESILYERLAKKHSNAVFQLLQNSFRVDEPINKSVGLELEESRQAFSDILEVCIEHGISFVAVDSSSGNIAGCRLSSIARKSDPHESFPNYPNKIIQIFTFLDKLGGDKFDLLPDAQKILKFEILSVDPAYRRRGIAQRLVDMSLKLALEEDFDYVSTTATSFKTQKLFEEKLGFKTIREMSLKEYKNEAGVQLFQRVPEDNEIAKLQVLKLK